MINLFIDPKDNVKVDVFVSIDKNEKIIVSNDKDKIIKENEGLSPDAVIQYEFVFRKPNYKDNMTLISKSVTSDGEKTNIDGAIIRYERFCGLIVSWTIVDEKGKAVPCSRENVGKLNPVLADAVISRFEELI